MGTWEFSAEQGRGRLVLVGHGAGLGSYPLAERPRLEDVSIGAPTQEPGHDFEFVVDRYSEQEAAVGQVLPARCLELTDATFERPPSYGTPSDGPADEPRRRVRVVFAAEVAASVQVPPSFEATSREHLADGRLLLTVTVDHEFEVMPWLLSWGAHAHILEPRALRERVAAEARAVADQYESAPTLLG